MESVNKLISGGRKQPCMDLNAIWTPCPRKSRTGHCRMFKKNTLKQLANNLWPSKINTHIYIYIYIYIIILCTWYHASLYIYIYIYGTPTLSNLPFFYIFITWLGQKGVTLHTGLCWGKNGNSFKRGCCICKYSSVVSSLGWFNLTSMIAFWEQCIQNSWPTSKIWDSSDSLRTPGQSVDLRS